MGASKENVQVTETEDLSNIIVLLNVVAEIQPILVDAGLALQHGITLFTENKKDYEMLQNNFLETGAVICKSFGKANQKVPNNKLGIHPYTLYDKEEAVNEFLESEGFIPVVMIYGIIPDFLRQDSNLLPFESNIRFKTMDFINSIQEFRTYAHQNSKLLLRAIGLFKTSKLFLQSQEPSSFITALEVAAEVFSSFYREHHNELQTEQKRAGLQHVVHYFKNLAECYMEECDVLDATKKSMVIYIDNHPQILLGRVDEAEGELAEAIQNELAILFDKDWYYIPERILRHACETITGVVSFPNIKRELHEQGILWCNNAAVKNFTVKKLLTNAYGYTFRARFLKIKKDFFISNDSLGLEERRAVKCFLEISMETHV